MTVNFDTIDYLLVCQKGQDNQIKLMIEAPLGSNVLDQACDGSLQINEVDLTAVSGSGQLYVYWENINALNNKSFDELHIIGRES